MARRKISLPRVRFISAFHFHHNFCRHHGAGDLLPRVIGTVPADVIEILESSKRSVSDN